MGDQLREFGNITRSLSRNPLGIIALFIVLVYGLASSVTIFSGSMSSSERAPIIYFLVLFPILVLAVFAWLVSCHSEKLFAPSDFKDEDNYVKMKLSAAVSLGAVSTKTSGQSRGVEETIRVVEQLQLTPETLSAHRKNHVLWVDDRPENNVHERRAFEAVGIDFTLSLNTNDALERLSKQKFAAVISDMGRKEGSREGYVLLDKMRQRGDMTPLFFYAASNAPEHKRETKTHGGQGCTNDSNELFEMVTRTVIKGGGKERRKQG